MAAVWIVALGLLAGLLVWWQTRPLPPATEVAPPPAAAVAVPPVAAEQAVLQAEPAPEVAEPRTAIPAGELQAHLESQDPEERQGALEEARARRRSSAMDWLNQNSNRRAAAARAAAAAKAAAAGR